MAALARVPVKIQAAQRKCACCTSKNGFCAKKYIFSGFSIEPRVIALVTPPKAVPGDAEGTTNFVSNNISIANDIIPDFCIIESREGMRDFQNLQLEEIDRNILSRRSKIFLLMEEVRRLRIQQRLKGGETRKEEQKYTSALPFLGQLTEQNLSTYYTLYAGFFLAVILFGGLLAPILEVKLGLGGTSYDQFVESMHLPGQLAQVDPIVASFCGGAVGVVSGLLVVEVSNVEKQQSNRCHYCEGTGYLMCGNCIGSGTDPVKKCGCTFCSSTGKVMCTGCLCTGKQMATEHDPRFDPF